MVIVNIAPAAPYNDNWGYQENLLPKYQLKLGNEVTVITTNLTHQNGGVAAIEPADYRLADGERIIRLAYRRYPLPVLTNLFKKLEVYELLRSIRPDFIFCHGLISNTIFDVIRYVRRDNPRCVVVQDNHMDFNNRAEGARARKLVGKRYYRWLNRRSLPYVARVYGVTPRRKTYAEEYFGIPPAKTDVLLMGADDEKIDFANRGRIRAELRAKYGFADDDFVIVTGGKIDPAKNITVLMRACKNRKGVKLLVFGSLSEDVKQEFEAALAGAENIVYIGWLASDQVYNYFFAADLVCFPGLHSVLWEQACACKVPCLFHRLDGMEHVNNGGNSDFVSPVTEDTLREKVGELLFTEQYERMRQAAQSEKTDIFLYSTIAEKSLECAEGAALC